MTMPHETGPAIGQPLVLHRQKGISLCLDRLRQQTAGAVTQNRSQGIVDLVGMLK